MGTSVTYYIDSNSFADATSVYTDSTLTTLAPDGYYSFGGIVRQQISGVLYPADVCGSCGTSCGDTINASGSEGIYNLTIDAGTDSLGAVIVTFDPFSVPDGLSVTYNTAVYNKLSSPYFGVRQSATAGLHTFVGATGSDCGISGSTFALDEYEYSGSAFAATGNVIPYTATSAQMQLTASQPGLCVMVIPKTVSSIGDVTAQIVAPCGGTAFDISISCPVLLDSIATSTAQPAPVEACGHPIESTHYTAYVNGSAGSPGLYDYIFLDAYGLNEASDGYYRYSGGYFQVANGVIVAFGTCP